MLLEDYVAGIFTSNVILLWLGITIFFIIANWKIFTKAGKPGWASLIPIYSNIVMFRIAKMSGFWVLVLLIPVVNVVILFIMYYNIAINFNRGLGTALGLYFFPYIFIPILAFGSATYID